MATQEITTSRRGHVTLHPLSSGGGRNRGARLPATGTSAAADATEATPAVITRTAWTRPAAAVFTVGWGANMFASVLQVYRGNLSGFQVNALFGAYALGLIPALLVMARVSDRLGRRRVLLAALLLSALGSAVILFSGGAFGTILAGRILVGVSAGSAFGPGTAWIKDLSDTAKTAGGGAGVGARRSAVALTAGFAFGPLLSGVIVQWLPSPETTAYLVHIALVALTLPMVWRASESALPAAGRRGHSSKSGDGPMKVLTSRLFLTAVLPTAPWVFGAATVSLAALPVLVPLGGYGAVGGGLVAAVTLGSGIAVQPWARRLTRHSAAAPFRVGMAAVVSGLLAAAVTVATGSLLLLLVTAVVLGSAYGLLLVSGLQLAESLAGPRNISSVIAVFYSLTYVGFAFPVLVQVLGKLWGPVPVLVAASALAVGALATTLIAWPARRTSRTGV
ncbi:MFS transporter [Streptomyces sp. TG1A-8]|uniref:MFS transporter n=1 Tax=Streptomyces sp. TG1A-8 TaxID=3051385 RepID=UPI00265BB946|nr:MFS transporter [Streptomyces sp. TG1A-8]MDO0929878.1 MFS transporter [Streptomyces sp. TG1A-8]